MVASAHAGSCPVCAGVVGPGIQSHGDPGGGTRYTLHECRRCHVQHWQPLVHPEAGYYEGEGMAMYATIHAGERAAVDPRFDRFDVDFGGVRGARMLDVGCSDGAFMSRVAQRGNETWGIDIDTRALALATSRGLNASQLSIEDFVRESGEADRRFDVITAFDVLEHLCDPVDALRRLASILVPGGSLVGTVPNRRRHLVNRVKTDFPPHHFFRFDAQSLARVLDAAGLEARCVDVFEYGYVVATVLDTLSRRMRTSVARGGAASTVAASQPGGGKGRRQQLARAILRATRPLSAAIERPLGRGFKLYFVASPRTGAA